MSSRFFFDVINGEEVISDEVGVEVSSLNEALAEARSVIAEMAHEVTGDDPGPSWTLIVRDDAGSVLGRLPIKR